MSDEREPLTMEQAIAMLPDGDEIHTFRQSGPMMIGIDWDRARLLKHMEEHSPELSGENATAMKHGMVLKDEHGWLFIATRETTPCDSN